MDHKEPKNRLKRGCVFGPKDLFYEDFFWYPLPILRKKIAKQDLNCYIAASVCLLVCWYAKRVFAVCSIIEECFSLHLGYKTFFFS